MAYPSQLRAIAIELKKAAKPIVANRNICNEIRSWPMCLSPHDQIAFSEGKYAHAGILVPFPTRKKPASTRRLSLSFRFALDLIGQGNPLKPNILVAPSKFGIMDALGKLEAFGGFRPTLFRLRHGVPARLRLF